MLMWAGKVQKVILPANSFIDTNVSCFLVEGNITKEPLITFKAKTKSDWYNGSNQVYNETEITFKNFESNNDLILVKVYHISSYWRSQTVTLNFSQNLILKDLNSNPTIFKIYNYKPYSYSDAQATITFYFSDGTYQTFSYGPGTHYLRYNDIKPYVQGKEITYINLTAKSYDEGRSIIYLNEFPFVLKSTPIQNITEHNSVVEPYILPTNLISYIQNIKTRIKINKESTLLLPDLAEENLRFIEILE